MRKNNKLIIIISIIFALLIAVAVFAYLIFNTDIFRSNKEVFAKYLEQEVENIEETIKLDTVKIYQNVQNESKYTSNTDIKLIHSEGGEVSNPLNNLSMNIDIQKDSEKQYFYGNSQILFGDEIYFASELIRDQEQYGIRFSEAIKQFVTIDEDEDIDAVAECVGIDANVIEAIIKIMNKNEEIILEDKIKETRDKWLSVITEEMAKGIFEKQRNAMITYNNVTTKTNAYSVELASEQVERILTEIFESPSEDVPTTKITIYVVNKQAIRTAIRFGESEIIIENTPQERQIKIKYINLSEENVIEYNIGIIRTNTENQENFEIKANVLEGEENYEVSLLSKMQKSNDTIQLDLEMSRKKEITTESIVLKNAVNIGGEFEKEETLKDNNFKSLSSIKDQTKRKQIVDSIKQIVIQQATGKIVELGEILIFSEAVEQIESGEGLDQAQINNFNAKFEFYTGEEVSAQNVKTLLDIVKGNCSGHVIGNVELTENSADDITQESETNQTKTTMMLYIKEGETNNESISKVLEQIDDNKKYKVLISYEETNGLIESITITEI